MISHSDMAAPFVYVGVGSVTMGGWLVMVAGSLPILEGER